MVKGLWLVNIISFLVIIVASQYVALSLSLISYYTEVILMKRFGHLSLLYLVLVKGQVVEARTSDCSRSLEPARCEPD